jgi:hypothetical protein
VTAWSSSAVNAGASSTRGPVHAGGRPCGNSFLTESHGSVIDGGMCHLSCGNLVAVSPRVFFDFCHKSRPCLLLCHFFCVFRFFDASLCPYWAAWISPGFFFLALVSFLLAQGQVLLMAGTSDVHQ